ncbi:hypothetical protein FQA39_LY16702 [Lamprigera yunnana]|nr:hypothetical protein FQA39_LY16702 [Lamprigera yunnana]
MMHTLTVKGIDSYSFVTVARCPKNPLELNTVNDIKAMSRSQKIVELARKQYTESNTQLMWMAPQSNFDDQLENLEHDEDRYEVESDNCSKHSDYHIKVLKKQ